jgi:hypothetical protein
MGRRDESGKRIGGVVRIHASMKSSLVIHAVLGLGLATPSLPGQVQRGEMYGYLLFDGERLPREFNAGFSMYVAAWPLLDHYPGHDFQTGLPSTWMFPLHEPGQQPK